MRRQLLILIIATVAIGRMSLAAKEAKTWKFVSIPDFLNVDVKYPEPKWDDALDYVLDAIKAENPDFVLVAGDEVMGRWWKGKDQIEKLGKLYYTAWTDRMKAHGLKYYVAVGDHEMGDNPWRPTIDGRRPRCAALDDVPLYKRAFARYMQMPQNGPEGEKGLTYSFMHKGTLFVVVDAFEQQFMGEGRGTPTVTGENLAWVEQTLRTTGLRARRKDAGQRRARRPVVRFETTLEKNAGADHVVVMAHPPILGPVRAQSSSRLMLKGGADSPLWQVMKRHGADLYLCGEVHAITCTERDGIEQIAHGGLFGYNDIVNYLVATVGPDRVQLELKAIRTDRSGGKLPQSAGNQPREFVKISKQNKKAGFRTVGTMTLDKSGGKKVFRDKKGIFNEDNNPKTAAKASAQGNKILEPYLTAPELTAKGNVQDPDQRQRRKFEIQSKE